MTTRKQFLRGAAAAVAAPALLPACSGDGSADSYEAAVRRTWQADSAATGAELALPRALVRLATLAPSSHNTQCWKFRASDAAISILPDFTRRTPAVDPDDHHLFVSLGCATENLAQAGLAHGLQAHTRLDAAADGGVRIDLEPTRAVMSPLFRAITLRQCTRGPYDGQPLSSAELRALEQAGTGTGVRIVLLTGQAALERVLEFVVRGNSAQMRDPAFVQELKQWIRFGEHEAVRHADGLYSASSGNPSVPRWLGSALFGLFFTEKNENDKYASQLRSSSGIAVFVSDADDRAHWVEVGRCYERFALQATALGIRNAMLNQPVEVAALRPQFSAALGLGAGRPDLVVRFGRGPTMPRSLRRPVSAVLL